MRVSKEIEHQKHTWLMEDLLLQITYILTSNMINNLYLRYGTSSSEESTKHFKRHTRPIILGAERMFKQCNRFTRERGGGGINVTRAII